MPLRYKTTYELMTYGIRRPVVAFRHAMIHTKGAA